MILAVRLVNADEQCPTAVVDTAGFERSVVLLGGEDVEYLRIGNLTVGARPGLIGPVPHWQFPTVIPYGISASVWNSRATPNPRSPAASSPPV